MKHILILILMFIMLCVLFGCSENGSISQPTLSSTQTVSPTQTASAGNLTITPGISPAVTPSSIQEPGKLSYTTGLPFNGAYKPVMVVIENSAAARPQTGLQTADVVYEVPVEGGITRFVCVFSDHVPDKVMPVRSGRVPFLYIQNEWSAVFMHFGGSGSSGEQAKASYSFYGNPLHDDIKIDVDGLSSKYDQYFQRVAKVAAPHNVMGNPLLAQKLYDYNPEPESWLFNSNTAYEGQNVPEINLEMCSGIRNYITYTYDQSNDVYLRSMENKKFTSAETGQQVTVKNIIVQYSTYSTSGGVKLWKMTGGGKADFYIGGKRIKGSWERKSVSDDTMYYDDKGQQIVLHPGNTWIHIHPIK